MNPHIIHVSDAPTLHVLMSEVEQKSEAVISLVTLWWLNAECSYQQLLPCITCNYKWPWAADEEPIRFQLACQPKTNYLLALTAGFYLHNSNPSANCYLQAAVTHSYWTDCLQGTMHEKPGSFSPTGKLFNQCVIKMQQFTSFPDILQDI